ncbi:complex I assembly factor ACAD9, mitochondrial-like [Microplitis mediator]|uniref:complex I assembly factor ACAD9, mitochondrial-like n=1 Tax=Microplitis mediator TaxID=375433 RepID=UPI002552D1DC|nr:complex I assembly factor ACAD9, mitochondrial-like [Microplitis mediator]
MLTRKLIVRQKLPRHIYIKTSGNNYSTTEVQTEVITPLEVRLSEHKPQLKRRPPFAKGLFVGKYDIEFAAFPEPQTHERHKEFFEWLKPVEEYMSTNINQEAIDQTGKIPRDVIEDLKDLDVLRAAVPDEYKGLGLNHSELSKLIETLAFVPPLGAYLAKQSQAVKVITENASDTQKENYLTRIASGEINPTVCISENTQGSNAAAIECTAERSLDDKHWVLNGSKTFVANADDSNLFVVFAECVELGRRFDKEDMVTAFLVEKDFGGITVHEPVQSMGLRGVTMSQVTFKNTLVPINNVIGDIGSANEFFTSVYSEGKEFIGSQAIGLTKNFLQALIKNLKSDKDFNAALFKSDSVQEIIAKICCSIFAMESVVYLTTGIIDSYANQDCNLEKCITEAFCTETCIKSILLGVPLLGAASFLKGNGIERLIRDAMCLTSFDGSLLNTKAVIALQGLQHTGNKLGDQVIIERNPLMFPKEILAMMVKFKRRKSLYIPDNLHPSLQPTATILEESIIDFEKMIRTVIIRNGQQVMDRQMELRRIAEVGTYLYVIAAILARSSRSYCLGMRDSEKEIKMAQVFGYALYQKAKQLIADLDYGDWINGDYLLKEIADSAFEKDKYFVEHPLARAF